MFATETDVMPLKLILDSQLTCSIATHFRYHTQNSSSFKNHLKGAHNIDKIATEDLIPNVSIVKYSSDKRDLMFYEALLI